MEVIKSKTFIIGVIIFIIIIAQLFRMDTLLRIPAKDHLVIDEYDFEKAIKLSESEINTVLNRNFLILDNSSSEGEINNIISIFDYLKAEYKIVDIDGVDINFNEFDTVVVLEQPDKKRKVFDELVEYTEQGGRLIYIGNGSLSDDSLLKIRPDFFGIKSWRESKETNDVYFNSEILLGLQGPLELGEDPLTNYYNFQYLDIDLNDNAIVHMEDIKGIPMIWELERGNGKLMVLNIGRYNSKESRGLIVGAISLFLDVFVYPILNSQVVFIDDFPADYNSNPELYKIHYGRNTDRFIKEIWWPDMVNLLKKYDLKYTAAYIENYDDKVDGNFVNNDLIKETTKELALNILRNGGEISFHGYNHQSLLFKEKSSKIYGYKSWKSPEDISNAITTTVSGFNTMFPEYKFYTYVPPSNLLDPEAIPALKKGLPTLKTISGLYFGELDDFGNTIDDVFLQEIGIDPRYGVALPRISSNSFFDEHMHYSISSVVTMHGLINHFIHPDDILDPERSLGLLWEDLYKKTDELFGVFQDKYFWIDKDIASVASEKVKQYDLGRIYYDVNNNTISILLDNFYNEASVIVATDRDIVSSTNSTFKKIGQNRYLVKMSENIVFLEVR